MVQLRGAHRRVCDKNNTTNKVRGILVLITSKGCLGVGASFGIVGPYKDRCSNLSVCACMCVCVYSMDLLHDPSSLVISQGARVSQVS